jgi:hypothetical protein
MKNFKSILMSGFIALGTISTVLVSCNEDLCKDKVCANGGICDAATGNCACATGWEGVDCKTASRNKFLNAAGYTVVEDGTSSASATYTGTIVASGTDSTALNLGNVWGVFVNTVRGTVNGSTVTIARQQPDADGYWVEGNGTMNSTGVMTLKYKITYEPAGVLTSTDDFGLAAGTPSTWTKK